MTFDRVATVEGALDAYLRHARPAATARPPDAALTDGSSLDVRTAIGLVEDQLASRQVDAAARELKKTDRSFYTIGSAGHENNAVLGAQLRTTDPAFLHYRSGAFMNARARQQPGSTPAFDALLGIVASSDEPISQGRHKVFGSRATWVPPQTSTIASHLPKAVGMAFSLARARRLGVEELPADAIVMCSFGDASANHATALAAFNTARYAVRIGLPMPILFVCEDNGTGISVPTPAGWVAETFAAQPYLRYVLADGELDEVWDRVADAVHHVRSARRPVFLHLPTVRLWGHAGSDAEHVYRTPSEIAETEARDPIVRNMRRLVELGAATPETLQRLLDDTRGRIRAVAEEAASRPRLRTRDDVVRPLAPYHPARVAERARRPLLSTREREGLFGGSLPEQSALPNARTLAGCINAALTDELARRPRAIVFGEDVARKGGVYNLTNGLQRRFGGGRVFDTLLDETTILGIAQGAALAGLLPLPEIQYLAYLHNALDQIRGEAASLQFFSSDQFRNPMVVRVAGLAYQKGFGGHFHNDNSIGALRDIPGLVLAVPSRGDDAARMLRGVVAMALEDGRVSVFLEPIALYHEKDLHVPGDGGWLASYPAPPRRPASRGGRRVRPVGNRHPAGQLRQRPAPVAAGRPAARRARRPRPRRRPALAQPAAVRCDPAPRGRVRCGARRRRVPCHRSGDRRRRDRRPGRRRHRRAPRVAALRGLVRAARSGRLDRAREPRRDRRRRPSDGRAAMSVRAALVLPDDADRAGAAIENARRSLQDAEPVAVLGVSIGWYAALAVAGVLDVEDALRLAQRFVDAEGRIDGTGQLVYPIVDQEWRDAPAQRAAIGAAERSRDVHRAVELGGFVRLAGETDAVSDAARALPPFAGGRRRYPLLAAASGARHTPLAAPIVSALRGREVEWRMPEVTLIDGRGRRHTPWSADPAALAAYSLEQLPVETDRFGLALRVALREYAPDVLLLPGARGGLAAACGQVVVAEGYAGLRTRKAFEARQRSHAPLVLSMKASG